MKNNMPTETDKALFELIATFDKLSDKGLYFWSSLLLPANFDYAKLMQGENSEVASNLCLVREQVLFNKNTRMQVESIRDEIAEKIANDLILNKMAVEFKE